ncbi:MAG: hypothetical protein CME99_04765 [Hyphomonas sp.]|uniref:TIGR04282 family arsenosugar biosynthesis glycosyltransferase n=1 Tax=unclassified Hyphomonas TaxID=2630699 RepID=UPI000B6B48A7|nr:DUF2064 domain-containing protein [Hyphomonas sp.]MAH92470.1 hypothetical protein [Hyphomonas sp.]OUX88290.1 MAG: hypothetical protein CBB91_04530 [Hyphomonas sp. TMED31]HBF90659.1 hypothetical protein [Hyphomonas atlantica]HBH45259.1 hypothetical protein [Hyphomonas atlantica]|tara:strand:+ start:551 stop:1156 length:606 start_codon:yes stop_codon:yes gene_type:complete
MRRARLLIYAKPPRMGLAKTRLAAGMGRTEARRIAHFTLARTMRAAAASGLDVSLYLSPDRALGETLGGLLPPHLPRVSQGPGTLTEKLAKGLADSPNGPVMFIGTDAPDISPALLLRAERLLSRNDAIFGPATDGGFWLFGLNKRPGLPPMFENVRWSGPHAMADLRKNLPSGFRVALLPTLQDVDTKEDWKIWSADNLC